ncbi:acyloxyacyl hydrolase [Algoriphagus boritolerans]|uniref:Lipid A 3-O-deacylase (PagL) n=1 Tax=Algoriphagus boritolerans DSM 17298 = JCM 18970 TaxID=1120964 RepID=A0A1H5TPR8_9BACT|nr:acyloxyacyl hydrolase [Algoriphagus boritolerans]SEF64852.1 Lipid A 3-O-deacylase (PagL) [Algoriphagus boritolerans DSM 17298 = JCM 18970]
MSKSITVGILVGLFFQLNYTLAQDTKFQKVIGLGYETGPLLSNGTDWGDEIKDAVDYRAIDFKIGWRKISNTTFNYLYRYPTLGLGFNSALKSYEEIGRPQSVYGFMEIPFSIKGIDRSVSFGYFTQLGVGFNLRPYDSIANPSNRYIGSKVNGYVNLGLNTTISISERVDFLVSFGLKHYSNGASKKPNSGINLFPINFSMRMKLGEIYPTPANPPVIPAKGLKTFWNFALYTGIKNYEIGEPSYFRGGLGINYLLEPAFKYRVGLGLDLFWAQGLHLRFPERNFSFRDQTSLAIVGSWEWQLTERLFVPIGLGAYLYRNELNQEITWFYERVGARYRIGNHLSAGMQIKAHKAKADFFEFTLGYTVPGKK